MTLFTAFGQFAGAGGGAPAGAGPGMVLMKPTSITNTSGTATLGTNGRVTFSGVTVLNINGCFTADFDNYALVAYGAAASSQNIFGRLRASGSDASGSNYIRQYLEAGSTTFDSGRGSATDSLIVFTSNAVTRVGLTSMVYGPYLAQPTAVRNINVRDANGVAYQDWAQTHSLSTSYDGISLISGVAITGSIAIYGIRS